MKVDEAVQIVEDFYMNKMKEKNLDTGEWFSSETISGLDLEDLKFKLQEKDAQDNSHEKPKVKLYCKNPECFKHYLANNKIKEVNANTNKEGEKG